MKLTSRVWPLLVLVWLIPSQLASVSSASPTKPEVPQLRILNWGDYLDPQLIARFEKQMNVTIVEEVVGNSAEMFALLKKERGGKYDVVVPGSDYIKVLAEQKLIAPLERAALPNFKNLTPDFLGRSFDPSNTYSVPYLWGAVGLLYNTQTIKTPVDGWSVFFDPAKRTGRFVWMDSPRETLGAAFKYAGESLNPKSKGSLERAERLLASAQGSTLWRGFASDVNLVQQVVQGQVDVAMVFSGDAIRALKSNPQLRYVLPKEGTVLFLDTLVVPARAPHAKLAHAFINFMLEPKNAAQNASTLGYPTPNRAALEFIDPKIRNDKNIYPDPAALTKLEFALPAGKLNESLLNSWKRIRNPRS